MSTRNRFALAGVAAVLMALSAMMYVRAQDHKLDDLASRTAEQLAAQDAANQQKLGELRDQHKKDLAAQDKDQLAKMNRLAQMTGEALIKVSQAAEAELQAAKKESEQRLDALKAENAALATKMAELAAAGNNMPAEPDLATFSKEMNGVVKIYEYASFEFDGIKSISFGPDGLKIEWGKFKFDGRYGHLTGFIVDPDKKADGSDEDYQYLWSAGHLRSRNNNKRPVKEIWCTFRDDLGLPPEKLELVGYDWRYDLSLLRFRKGFKFPGKAFKLGDVNSVRPGDKVVAMGCPLDVQFAATEGEVMDKDYVGMDLGFTQPRLFVHSAPITFGNSGGPLILKRTGEVIGVNVMLVDEPGGYFLTTMVDDMKAMYPRLKAAHGTEVMHSTLEHVAFANSWRLNPPDWNLIGVKAPAERCVVVTEVMKGSAMEAAGLKAGDVVMSWNGVAPKNDADLWRMVTNTVGPAAGTMKVKRGTEEKELKLALGIFKGQVFVHEWNTVEEVTPPPKQ